LQVLPESELSPNGLEPRESGTSSFAGTPVPALHRVTPPVDEFDSDDEELAVRQTIEEKFKHISLDPGKQHFIGKSSNLMFIQTAMEFQEGSSDGGSNHKSETSATKPVFFDSSAVSPFSALTSGECTNPF
jgi:hypothetical protein